MDDLVVARTKPDVRLVDGRYMHNVAGKVSHNFSYLKITQLAGDKGYYLFYFNEDDNEITDTYHDSIIDALKQAKYEFSIDDGHWDFYTKPP